MSVGSNDNLNIYGFFHFPVPMKNCHQQLLEQSGSASRLVKLDRDTTQTCTAVHSAQY